MEAAEQKQFKFTDEIREKVLKFGECYYGALPPEEKGSYPEFLSALNKEHPEINLKSHSTFFKYFPGLIEKWKRDFGKTFRACHLFLPSSLWSSRPTDLFLQDQRYCTIVWIYWQTVLNYRLRIAGRRVCGRQ